MKILVGLAAFFAALALLSASAPDGFYKIVDGEYKGEETIRVVEFQEGGGLRFASKHGDNWFLETEMAGSWKMQEGNIYYYLINKEKIPYAGKLVGEFGEDGLSIVQSDLPFMIWNGELTKCEPVNFLFSVSPEDVVTTTETLDALIDKIPPMQTAKVKTEAAFVEAATAAFRDGDLEALMALSLGRPDDRVPTLEEDQYFGFVPYAKHKGEKVIEIESAEKTEASLDGMKEYGYTFEATIIPKGGFQIMLPKVAENAGQSGTVFYFGKSGDYWYLIGNPRKQPQE